MVIWNNWAKISPKWCLATNFALCWIWLNFSLYLWLPDSEDITGSLLQKALFPTKCNKELASVTFQSPDFEYTPSDVPEVHCWWCFLVKYHGLWLCFYLTPMKIIGWIILVIELFNDDCVINFWSRIQSILNISTLKEKHWDLDWRFWMLRFKHMLVVLTSNSFWHS